jgi:hypothetical protein
MVGNQAIFHKDFEYSRGLVSPPFSAAGGGTFGDRATTLSAEVSQHARPPSAH